MSGARAATERLRLFVALELPEDARGALVRWRESVAADALARETAAPAAPGLRMIASEYLHATLCFIGWRDADVLPAVVDACDTLSARRAPQLRLDRALWLPRRRPRVLAVQLSGDDELAQIQSQLSLALSDVGYVPEKRPYLPHVTVARVRAGARPRPVELPAPPAVRFEAPRVTLYRSLLGAGGARYEPLSVIELV